MRRFIRKRRAATTDALQEFSGRVRYRLNKPPWPAPVFVLGTGRSGTTWVGRILDSHPEIAGSIERPRFFALARDMALDPSKRDELFPRLVELYRFEIARVAPRHFADKSHPNIWIADRLAAELPEAVFVGIHRSVYGTVASMLKHRGVLKWSKNWRQYPVPNPFLGIEENEGEWYDSLSPVSRSALRWVSHEKRFTELRSLLGPRLIEVEYEQLHAAPEVQLRPLADAIGLTAPFPSPATIHSSLDRWRSELSDQQIAEIDTIVSRKLGTLAA